MNFEKFILNSIDGIASANYNLLGMIIGLIALIFWLVVIGWVWVDSGERTTSKQMRIFYIFISIIPVAGWIIYLIIRPIETIDEIYWGDLERRYLKFETSELGDCPRCGTQLFPGYIYCPNCRNEIKKKCPQCGVFVDIEQKFCIHCGNQMQSRAVVESFPDTQAMQEQIDATKEEAHESVKAKKSKYKSEVNFVSKIGGSIIKGYTMLGKKLSNLTKGKDIKEGMGPQEPANANFVQESPQKPPQINISKHKKKKHKKKKRK